jgi:hypothetical protein
MAATDGCSGNCPSFFVNKTHDKQEGNCLGCIELRLELQKVKTDILSYEKIIKVLQEELYKKELLNNTGSSEQEDYSGTILKLNQ